MGKIKLSNVYQFKILLKGIKPPIWRRIQVPENYSFWDFHVAIQDSMGWYDQHLHEFEIISPDYSEEIKIGIPYEDFEEEVLPGWEKNLRNYFSLENKTANYNYDFGDDWRHKIILEKILPSEAKSKYPKCVGGKRACPPEDCGGIWGYQDMLEVLKNPDDEEYDRIIEWLGDRIDSEKFEASKVKFSDPKKRFKLAFGR